MLNSPKYEIWRSNEGHVLLEVVDQCTCCGAAAPYAHEQGCGTEPIGTIEDFLDKAVALEEIRQLIDAWVPGTMSPSSLLRQIRTLLVEPETMSQPLPEVPHP